MFGFNPVPKPDKKRKKKSKNFTPATIRAIRERDHHACVACGTRSNLEAVPHHIHFKSAGGGGEKRNGATLCVPCHRHLHGKDGAPMRYWMEEWKERMLDANGDYKDGAKIFYFS